MYYIRVEEGSVYYIAVEEAGSVYYIGIGNFYYIGFVTDRPSQG